MKEEMTMSPEKYIYLQEILEEVFHD